jgi:hypothetical protein
VKTLLGYLALVALVLGLANFAVFAATQESAVPIYVSHPLGMLAAFYLLFVFVIPTMLGRQAARVLPPAGPPVAMFRSGGRIGRVAFSGKLIKVTVYADRIVLKPVFLGEYTIHGSEIQSITDLGGMMFRRVRIEHAGAGTFSRVTLYSVPDHARSQIAHISRDPWIAAHYPPPARDEVAQAAGRRITSIMFVLGFVVGVSLVAVGIVMFAHYQQPFLLVWAAAMLAGTFVVAREFVKFRRRA